MRILITGGAGFIGAQIVHKLRDTACEMLVLDDFSAGSLANLPPDTPVTQADIRDELEVDRIVRDMRPHVVCHQAAQTSALVSLRDPGLDAAVNIGGTINLLRSSVAAEVRRFIFASSGGAIYGEVAPGQMASSATRPAPLSPYGCSKLAAEAYVSMFGLQHGFKSHILRYSNVYGPGQRPRNAGGVVATFAACALVHEPLSIHGFSEPNDQGCVRDYIYIDDVVNANLRAIYGELPTGVVNVSTGIPTTTRALAEALISMTSSRSILQAAPPRLADVDYSVLAPSSDLPCGLPLEAGLALTMAWLREWPGDIRAGASD